jgi:hypothetical protein
LIDFGIVRPGTTLYIPFATYDSNDPSASVTLTGLATTDIEIYKDGGVTQRASDAGYALLDTDGIDFDTVTGIHGFSIDLADNTTAGFYATGSQYWVVVASITVDAATVNFLAATFRIGYPNAALNTTIATLASQTSFTLTVGPAEDDALNGWIAVIHDVASAVQLGHAVVQDYTGVTKTITLTAGTTFTAAATDNISLFPPVNSQYGGTVAYTATRGLAGTALPAAAADAAGGLPISDAGGLDLDAQIGTDIDAILVDTSTTLDDFIDTEIATIITDIAAVKADTAAILLDTGTDGVALAAGAITSTKFAAGAIDTAAVGAGVVGAVDKNAAFSNFEFLMVDSTDHVTPKTGLVVTGTRSIDGGAFAAVAGAIAEVANGIYQFDALAADTNGDLITWRFISATADDVFVTFRTVA